MFNHLYIVDAFVYIVLRLVLDLVFCLLSFE